MATLRVRNFSVQPNTIGPGSTPVTVFYDCEIEEPSQNLVQVTLFVITSLHVSFKTSSWSKTFNPGVNKSSRSNQVIASGITSNQVFKVIMEVKDAHGNTDKIAASLIYKP